MKFGSAIVFAGAISFGMSGISLAQDAFDANRAMDVANSLLNDPSLLKNYNEQWAQIHDSVNPDWAASIRSNSDLFDKYTSSIGSTDDLTKLIYSDPEMVQEITAYAAEGAVPSGQVILGDINTFYAYSAIVVDMQKLASDNDKFCLPPLIWHCPRK